MQKIIGSTPISSTMSLARYTESFDISRRLMKTLANLPFGETAILYSLMTLFRRIFTTTDFLKDNYMMETKPCIFCGRELESALPDNDWSTLQPDGGGQVTFNFHYGSCKFDHNMHGTQFVGIVCDDCAETCVERMTRTTENTQT